MKSRSTAHPFSPRIKRANPIELIKSLNIAIIVFEKSSLTITFANTRAAENAGIRSGRSIREYLPNLFSDDTQNAYPDQSYTHIKTSKGHLHFAELRFHELPHNPKFAFIEIYLKPTPSAPPPLTPTSPSTQSSDPHILLVEDDPMNQAVMKSMIEQAGHDCDIASNGLDALNACINKDYEMVLMDLMMPIMNGRQAISTIRSTTEIRKQPEIAIMTANTLDLQVCKKEYPDIKYFLSKPISLDQIESIIAKVKGESTSKTSSSYQYSCPQNLSDLANSDDPNINRQIIKNMINAFKDGTPDTLEKLTKSIECENYNLIATHAHTLRNAYHSTGSAKALKLVVSMEEEANKREKIPILKENLRQLKAMHESIIEELEIFEKEIDQSQ